MVKGGGGSATAQVMKKMRGMKSRGGGDGGDRLCRRMMGKCCARRSMERNLKKESKNV